MVQKEDCKALGQPRVDLQHARGLLYPGPSFQKVPRKTWQRFRQMEAGPVSRPTEVSPHLTPARPLELLFHHLSVKLSVNWTKKSCACICNHLEQMSPSRCRCKRRCKWNASHSPMEVSSAPVRTRTCLHTITGTGLHSAQTSSHGFAFFGHRYSMGLMSISVASCDEQAPPGVDSCHSAQEPKLHSSDHNHLKKPFLKQFDKCLLLRPRCKV